MPALQSGWVELAVLALVFVALQIWWLSAIARRRRLAQPLTEQEFRQVLERIWLKRSPTDRS
ncbi:hypothetical protein MY494_12925 [Synechococcus sp. A10-1-5-1]|uniref:hypothetical protein n=1 Tax=Synechococcus sp. A10-1-5-1 TaxID=2936507 RepID=UPI002001280F|nr:hypothetical protein [Synechococcus sp. A10-1-5-1]UPM50187.1 hypothetical protein MY494_12925 [Synechococcus sp. A10-1-5-1]